MADSDKVFSGSIRELYDAYLVPLIFDSYARDIADRAVALAPQSVLETATGSGVVTRALSPRLASDAYYVATDLNQPMLDHARNAQGADERITWRQADAQDLPFDDRAFDVVVCQFGVMFFPNRIAGYAEARRVQKPGGKFIFSVWDRIEANEFAHIVTEPAASIFPDDPPGFLPRTPHGYHDVKMIRDDLGQAGFSRVSVDTLEEISSAPSPRDPAVAYCEGTPLRNEVESRDASLLGRVTEKATQAIAEKFGHGPVAGKIRAHIMTAER